jgi:hypothetical protein
MMIRVLFPVFGLLLAAACSGSTTDKPAASPSGESKPRLSQADCTARLKKHGELCAEDDQAREANAKMIETLCPKTEQNPELSAWLNCLTDVPSKEQCGDEAAKCKPLYDELHSKKPEGK